MNKKSKLSENNENSFYSILLRYFLLVILAVPNLFLFYFIFRPLTLYPVYFLFGLFFNPSLAGNIIIFKGIAIELINACIAGSAYYLLSILNLSTPKIKLKKRIKMIFLSLGIFLIINILRIFLLGVFFIKGYSFFSIAHELFWYFGSTILVVAIWFAEVKLFKIKEIPIYSDVKFLYNKTNLKKSLKK